MKQLLSRALLITAMVVFACASSLSQEPRISSTRVAQKSILIVYLSRTENTAVVANIIREQVGGSLERIEIQTPYPADYDAIVAQVAKENETGYLPPLKTSIQNIRAYDIVFVGFPTWGMQLPPPMKSFLKGHDLSGKTIVPFNTHGGYGSGSSFRSIEELCPTQRYSKASPSVAGWNGMESGSLLTEIVVAKSQGTWPIGCDAFGCCECDFSVRSARQSLRER